MYKGASGRNYGTRCNGVIIITTKSGQRESRANVTYHAYGSLTNWYKKAEFMDTRDVIFARTNFPYDGYNTDWLDAVTRKMGHAQNHSISIDGGTKSATYSANITYSDEAGIMRKSDRRDLKAHIDESICLKHILFINLLYGTHGNTTKRICVSPGFDPQPSSPLLILTEAITRSSVAFSTTILWLYKTS